MQLRTKNQPRQRIHPVIKIRPHQNPTTRPIGHIKTGLEWLPKLVAPSMLIGALMLHSYLDSIGMSGLFASSLSSPVNLLALTLSFGLLVITIWLSVLFAPLSINASMIYLFKDEKHPIRRRKYLWRFGLISTSIYFCLSFSSFNFIEGMLNKYAIGPDMLFYTLVIINSIALSFMSCSKESLSPTSSDKSLTKLITRKLDCYYPVYIQNPAGRADDIAEDNPQNTSAHNRDRSEDNCGNLQFSSNGYGRLWSRSKGIRFAFVFMVFASISQMFIFLPVLFFAKIVVAAIDDVLWQWIGFCTAIFLYGVISGFIVDQLENVSNYSKKLKERRIIIGVFSAFLVLVCAFYFPQIFIEGASRFVGFLEKESAAQWYKIDKDALAAVEPRKSTWNDKYWQSGSLYGFMIFQIGDVKVLCHPDTKLDASAKDNCFIFRASDLRPIGRPAIWPYSEAYKDKAQPKAKQ